MHPISTVTVTVPATTANLGPGFDCIGAALTLHNQFKFTRLDIPQPSSATSKGGEKGRVNITVTDSKLGEIPCGWPEQVNTDADNLVYKAFLKLYKHLGKTPPPVQIEINLGIPLARGLGSSATAIAGGLVGANLLAGSPLSQTQVMELAIAIEGHPDNVVPALLGGCRLAATGLEAQQWEICDIIWHPDIVPVVAIPDFELSTGEARRVLPLQYTRADAIFNTAHLGLLVRGLETGRVDWLRTALQDKIHQPYRKALIPGYDAVYSAALGAGAFGMVISGAGPTVLALASQATASAVAFAMADAWNNQGIKAEARSLSIDTQGAKSTAGTGK